jgi:hypothetical protein
MDEHPSVQILVVGDRAEARDFYVGSLEGELIAETPRGLLVGRGRRQLIALLVEDAHLSREVRLLGRALAAGGAEVIRAPGMSADGGLDSVVRDPWGNLLRLVER